MAGLVTAAEADLVDLRQGDAFAPGAFSDATVVYMLSTAFPRPLLEQFITEVGPKLRWVVSSKLLPHDLLAGKLTLDRVIPLATTWTTALPLHVYRAVVLPPSVSAGGY